jgi:hypothetical protein
VASSIRFLLHSEETFDHKQEIDTTRQLEGQAPTRLILLLPPKSSFSLYHTALVNHSLPVLLNTHHNCTTKTTRLAAVTHRTSYPVAQSVSVAASCNVCSEESVSVCGRYTLANAIQKGIFLRQIISGKGKKDGLCFLSV